MNVNVTGTILAIDETKVISDKFQKREVIVKESNGEYPQAYCVQFVQDKCAVLDAYKVGQEVSIDADLRGREWTNKEGKLTAFNTVQGWKINATMGTTAEPNTNHDTFVAEGDSDLPF